jgi:hypothetical protein
MGVMPQPFLDRVQPALDRTLERAAQRAELGRRLGALPAPGGAAATAATAAIAPPGGRP